MTLTETILDEAYPIFEEWGPKRRINRGERLKQEYPLLSDQELSTLLQEMKEVTRTVWKIAEMGGEQKIGRIKVINTLQEKHPFLKDKGLAQAITLINYYTWHEGYDK